MGRHTFPARPGLLSTLVLGLLAVLPLPAQAPPNDHATGVVGDWRIPGGATVRVAPCGADLCATLLQLGPNAPTRIDSNNPDPAKRQTSLCGLRIGYGFHSNSPDRAEDGHLCDPKTGKTYKGTVESHGKVLSLRGYIGLRAFGRTEEWTRLLAGQPTCR